MTLEIFLFIVALAAILIFTLKPIKTKKQKEQELAEQEKCNTCPIISDFKNFKEEYYKEKEGLENE